LECLAVASGAEEALVAEAHVGLGWAALAEGDYGAAGTHLGLALELTADTAVPCRVGALVWSGELAFCRGDHDAARGHYLAALALLAPADPSVSTPALLELGPAAGGVVSGAGEQRRGGPAKKIPRIAS
jgi:Flp pilus assembly protein TadD